MQHFTDLHKQPSHLGLQCFSADKLWGTSKQKLPHTLGQWVACFRMRTNDECSISIKGGNSTTAKHAHKQALKIKKDILKKKLKKAVDMRELAKQHRTSAAAAR